MMTTFAIYKYPLDVTDLQPVQMPVGARVLSVQFQQAYLKLWALVDPNKPLTNRSVMIFVTGHSIDQEYVDHYDYVGTVQDVDRLVWHVFIAREAKP